MFLCYALNLNLTYETSWLHLIFEYVGIWWPLNDLQTTSTLIYLCDITYSFFILSTFLCCTIHGISNALSQQLLNYSPGLTYARKPLVRSERRLRNWNDIGELLITVCVNVSQVMTANTWYFRSLHYYFELRNFI